MEIPGSSTAREGLDAWLFIVEDAEISFAQIP
jgi:hypothetical protein